MSESVIVAMIAAVPPTLMATASLLVALRTRQDVVHYEHKVNSRLDELISVTRSLAHAEGHAEGMIDERERERERER